MADEGLLPANALENAPKVIPPLAGFWFRFGALVLDLLILHLVLRVTFPALQPLYLAIGKASTALALLLIFLYLFLSDGPIGKGMTLGKMALKIRATDATGAPLRPTAAALRALGMLGYAVPLLWSEVARPFESQGEPNRVFAITFLMWDLATGYVMANIFLVVLHPLKQGAHDLLAGSVVVREAGARQLPAYLVGVAEYAPMLRRRALQTGLAAFVILTAVAAYRDYRRTFSPEERERLQLQWDLAERFAYGNFQADLMPARLRDLFQDLRLHGFTTDTLKVEYARAGLPDPSTTATFALAILFMSPTRVAADDIGTTAELAALKQRAADWVEQALRENRYPLADRQRKRMEKDRESGKEYILAVFQPRYGALLYSEDVYLILFGSRRYVHFELFPLKIPEGLYEKELAEAAEKRRPTPSPTPTPGGGPAPSPKDRPTTATKDRPTTASAEKPGGP
jgi:uncharacterized RDD family membrane protein YckC